MNAAKPSIRKILIVKPGPLGDVLLATPVPRALKGRLPDSHVAWLVEEPCREAVEGHPYVDEVLPFPRQRWQALAARGRYVQALREMRRFLRDLRDRRFDLAIDLQGLFRSGLVTWLSGAPYRLGRDDGREGNPLFLTHMVQARGDYVRASEFNLEVLSALGINPPGYDLILKVPAEAEEWAERFLADEGVPPRAGITAMVPAAPGAHGLWSLEAFAEVIDRLREEHQLRTVLLAEDGVNMPALERIAGLCRHRPLIAPEGTTCKQSAALIKRSRILVSVDAGHLRIGLATKTPTVALFGPADLRQEERITLLSNESPRPADASPDDRSGLRVVTPDDVMHAVAEWLHSSTYLLGQ